MSFVEKTGHVDKVEETSNVMHKVSIYEEPFHFEIQDEGEGEYSIQFYDQENGLIHTCEQYFANESLATKAAEQILPQFNEYMYKLNEITESSIGKDVTSYHEGETKTGIVLDVVSSGNRKGVIVEHKRTGETIEYETNRSEFFVSAECVRFPIYQVIIVMRMY